MKRLFIIHGWEGNPQEGWYPWLKQKLEKINFEVCIPQMPNPNNPKLSRWLKKINKIIVNPDKQTFFVGHSLGCITILNYLENLPSKTKVGGAIFVAGFPEPIGYGELNSFFIKPLNYKKIKTRTKNFIAINSNNDPYVNLRNGKILRDELGAKLIIAKKMKHFSGSEGTIKLPVVLDNLLEII